MADRRQTEFNVATQILPVNTVGCVSIFQIGGSCKSVVKEMTTTTTKTKTTTTTTTTKTTTTTTTTTTSTTTTTTTHLWICN